MSEQQTNKLTETVRQIFERHHAARYTDEDVIHLLVFTRRQLLRGHLTLDDVLIRDLRPLGVLDEVLKKMNSNPS